MAQLHGTASGLHGQPPCQLRMATVTPNSHCHRRRHCQHPWLQQQPWHHGPTSLTTCSSSSSSQQQATLARDVRAMPIKVVTVSKGNSQGATLMASEWSEKIRRYTALQEVQIKPNPKKAAAVQQQKAAEGEKVLKSLDARDWVVLLDERGKEIRSEDLARIIAAAGDRGAPLAFCIGGPFGHSDEVRARSNESIRLTNMVLNHQVAHVVLLEQIYRGWTILRGEPYHH